MPTRSRFWRCRDRRSMMRNLDEHTITQAVIERHGRAPTPRLRELMTALVQHLHAFARDIRLTEAEWFEGIRFLTAAGHITDDKRQEFILLSDVLGLSLQTITINHAAVGEAPESTLLGPFFGAGSPAVELGGDIAFGASGEPCWVSGTVRDEAGNPVPDALLEVWE